MKNTVEMEKYKLLKSIRMVVRLKHALRADTEINAVVGPAEAQFERRVAAGEPFAALADSVFEQVRLLVFSDGEASARGPHGCEGGASSREGAGREGNSHPARQPPAVPPVMNAFAVSGNSPPATHRA